MCNFLFRCRHITITGYQHDNPEACLRKWNVEIEKMMGVCKKVGTDRCLRCLTECNAPYYLELSHWLVTDQYQLTQEARPQVPHCAV